MAFWNRGGWSGPMLASLSHQAEPTGRHLGALRRGT